VKIADIQKPPVPGLMSKHDLSVYTMPMATPAGPVRGQRADALMVDDYFPALGGKPAKMGKAALRILQALAMYHGRTLSKRRISLLTGYRISGNFANALSELRSANRIEGIGDEIRITDQGLKDVGSFKELPTGLDLRNYWIARTSKAASAILRLLCEVYPNTLSKEEIAERSGYQISGNFANALSELRGLGFRQCGLGSGPQSR